jgi:uncharacterized protein YeaO (DUF488 family)
MAIDVRLKRAREDPEPSDGQRVLVDRLWPRGVSKQAAALDDWVRDIAPSDELRTWYGHDPERFDEFRRRYVAELGSHRDELSDLRRRAREGTLTLVFAARDAERSNAAVLASVLRNGLR